MTKSKQVYPTDLNDTQWLKIQPYLPAESDTGRPREYGCRVILNSIFDILQSGCSWRMLPKDLPPWQTVYLYFRLWRKEGIWEELNQVLREKARRKRYRIKSQRYAKSVSGHHVQVDVKFLKLKDAAGKPVWKS